MKELRKTLVRTVLIAAGLLAAGALPTAPAFADEQGLSSDSRHGEGSLRELSAQWWQLVLSIPPGANPLADTSGGNCMVGERGPVWFLYGTFGNSAAVARNCSVPEGKALFFPVVNFVNINTPDLCGVPSQSQSVRELRDQSAPFVDSAKNLAVEVDGQSLKHLAKSRVQSIPFEVSVPADNLFTALGVCFPSGIYSPAVDDGFYVLLKPLAVGLHTIHIHGELPAAGSVVEVSYNLTVVPVNLK